MSRMTMGCSSNRSSIIATNTWFVYVLHNAPTLLVNKANRHVLACSCCDELSGIVVHKQLADDDGKFAS